MLKKTLNLTCDVINVTQNNSSVRFIEPMQKQKQDQPGQRRASVMMIINFADPKAAKDFEAGKKYPVTIG